MLKHRHPARQDACSGSDASSSQTLRAAGEGAHGNGFSVTVSDEMVVSPISRLFQHLMMCANVCDGWDLFCSPLTGLYITYLLP